MPTHLLLIHFFKNPSSPGAPSSPASKEEGTRRLTDIETHPLYLWLNIRLLRLLYPNDSEVIRGGAQIKDTDKPFADKVLTREFDRLFNLWLSKNNYMIDTKVAEAMKMNEKEEEEK
ncbi:hypothetical protein [Dickeya poaceiphila]|uniref:hypothetical protein n=1 Tax=Dickeya poaceiphila TaxID=568768 RepID=UPI001D158CF8|nr:hypothetical protein [Dickeya poaceiphila]